jgi:hypothetical protein
MTTNDVNKEVRYINKDFVSLRKSLIDFSKVYFPNTYNDFNESSVGMMFIEMSAYVGDMLSYYIDSTLKEQLLYYAEERKNIIYLAQSLGYKYKTTVPSTVNLDVYQLIPATGVNGEDIDFRFALRIDNRMVVVSETYPNIEFITTNPIDFSNYSDNNFTATVYQVDEFGNPLFYLLKKVVSAVAGTIQTYEVSFTTPEQFKSISLPDADIIEILDVIDSDGNVWYEVDYLAQDTIFFDEDNIASNNTTDNLDVYVTPKILKFKKVSDRFTTKTDINGITSLNFGSGISSKADQLLVPSIDSIKNNVIFDTANLANQFLNTRTYGHVPSNTTLTIRYTIGGGIESNVPSNDLKKIKYSNIKNSATDFSDPSEGTILNTIKRSLAVNNSVPATGGRGEESNEEIRQNAIAFFASQDRCVTDMDYLARIYQMPAKYGSISKAYIEKDVDNYAVNIYVLGYDENKKLTQLNDSTKQNLKTYLSHYRDLSTGINIKDGYIVNIGVNFDILTFPKYNKNDVLLNCIDKLKTYFNIDVWTIGQTIVLNEIYTLLSDVTGVRSVANIDIINKYQSSGTPGYSNNYYYIKAATQNGIIYPSLDPSIFEIKYPNSDIFGKAK